MKKSIKIISVLVLIVMIVSTFSTVFAVATDPGTLKGDTVNDFKNVGNKIIGMVQAIGSIVSVLILVILGIKYKKGTYTVPFFFYSRIPKEKTNFIQKIILQICYNSIKFPLFLIKTVQLSTSLCYNIYCKIIKIKIRRKKYANL